MLREGSKPRMTAVVHGSRSAPLPEVLTGVITLVREAGARLAAEFALPGGPRAEGEKAPEDAEI